MAKASLFFSPPDKTLPLSPVPMRVLRLSTRPTSLSKRSIFSRTSEERVLLSSFILAWKRIVEGISHSRYSRLRLERKGIYHKPYMLAHRHRLDEHVVLVHEAAVTSHVRGRSRHAIHADFAVHHDAGCKFNRETSFLLSFLFFFKIHLRESYLRPAWNASAVISELFPAPLRRVWTITYERRIVTIMNCTQAHRQSLQLTVKHSPASQNRGKFTRPYQTSH